VRPEPPSRGGEPAPWTGAGQSLGDIAPTRDTAPSPHRADIGETTAIVRAAAAGHALPHDSSRHAPASPAASPASGVARRGGRHASFPIAVSIGISNRHVHLAEREAHTLFGPSGLTVLRPLKQPGQFAANETVSVSGPRGHIDGIRVVGPARGDTQLEVAFSDAARLGITPPVAASGRLDGSLGGVTLEGPAGRLTLARGVIIAARHLHLAPADASRWGLRDGDLLTVRCGDGPRTVTFHDVLVRSGPAHATELHLDADEARACGITSGATANIIAVAAPSPGRRRLITERDIIALVRQGQPIPAGAMLTPSARDRARALGLLVE
jgi:putative phosphotransacetylase